MFSADEAFTKAAACDMSWWQPVVRHSAHEKIKANADDSPEINKKCFKKERCFEKFRAPRAKTKNGVRFDTDTAGEKSGLIGNRFLGQG